jgi:hypothetical protein
MKLNEAKSNFMVFSRSKEKFATRQTFNCISLDRIKVAKYLGVRISEYMSWSRNCQEICKSAYSRLSLIIKLKYVGVSMEDLLDIYILFIRSVAEYCSVVFHSSLTQQDSNKLKKRRKKCLKIIIGELYEDYPTALEFCGLITLSESREIRCFDFSLKCTKHVSNTRIFPRNPGYNQRVRDSEPFTVNFASTSDYRDSAIPFCQRLLNTHFEKTN